MRSGRALASWSSLLVALAAAASAVPAGPATPAAPAAPSAAPAPATPRLVDRVVAMVDQDPILLSDLERTIALRLVEVRPGEDAAALRRRVLDDLIEQRLRAHEVERFGFQDLPAQEIDAQVAALRARFPDEQAFRAELAASGTDEAGLRQLLTRQMLILLYVEERLGPRVFVGLEDIRKYYDETLTPELTGRGQPVPPLDDVREEIRSLLKEQRLNEEIDRWTTQLRREADVVDYLDSVHAALPPLVPSARPH